MPCPRPVLDGEVRCGYHYALHRHRLKNAKTNLRGVGQTNQVHYIAESFTTYITLVSGIRTCHTCYLLLDEATRRRYPLPKGIVPSSSRLVYCGACGKKGPLHPEFE